MYPYTNTNLINKGLSLLKSIKWGTILDGTGKTLGVINQAIPIVYQIKPMINNAKTLISVMNGLNTNNEDNKNKKENKPITNNSNNSPIFYI